MSENLIRQAFDSFHLMQVDKSRKHANLKQTTIRPQQYCIHLQAVYLLGFNILTHENWQNISLLIGGTLLDKQKPPRASYAATACGIAIELQAGVERQHKITARGWHFIH